MISGKKDVSLFKAAKPSWAVAAFPLQKIGQVF
jgi:hypothetical protein